VTSRPPGIDRDALQSGPRASYDDTVAGLIADGLVMVHLASDGCLAFTLTAAGRRNQDHWGRQEAARRIAK
jgi:hypothetical protein